LMVPVEGYYMHAVDKLWKMLAWSSARDSS
jgi:hypothetical protein